MKNPDWRHLLRENFAYDLYANRTWLPFVISKGNHEEKSIFRHLLGASSLWLVRFGGESPTTPPQVKIDEESLIGLHRGWMKAMETYEFESAIEYFSLGGKLTSAHFGDIARHVVNHATYHRGQMRESFGARGEEFPDTDFLVFAFSRDE